LRPTQANSLKDFVSKISRAKWTGGVAQAVKHLLYESLLCKNKALSSNPGSRKKKKKERKEINKLGINFLNQIKSIYQNLTSNIMINGTDWMFPPP
jgi:hypothetical protein